MVKPGSGNASIDRERPVIAGAGPVGLGAAVLLARQGCRPRLIEARHAPSQQSRALAVNPRTLGLFEASGVSDAILRAGLKIRGALFHRDRRVIAALRFAGMHPRYPFMVALSQAHTERLLEHALRAAGGEVFRGTVLAGCASEAAGARVSLAPAEGGGREHRVCPWLLAADGAHSTAREALGIEFAGGTFAHHWHLVDVALKTRLAPDHAHIFLSADGGFRFLLRVVDDRLGGEHRDPLWRVLSNRAQPLTNLDEIGAEQTGAPVWQSRFPVAHRVATRLGSGHVYLAGDAAHVHSPVGARGMNLGLEDAWVFAQLASANRLPRYEALRAPVVRQVVRRVRALSQLAAGESILTRSAQRLALPLATRLAPISKRMRATLTGLDHDLPRISMNRDA